ncbi:hypothetical protein P22_4006 [Propionispora sp. 2/2-37]|uniref:hypothetical protein n=1 Tax=Propionispora sp. 2/2-37 TaxID=1677858 RepID=UPI0006BB89FF|nr:hypothetical protein [Propionispora sp. 2/2-37]CUH97859.1 hypothetical protein P22_4006 [Propionispora sp. 2/2-37]
MELICPICNGLQSLKAVCPQCGQLLLDGGTIEDYWGAYSPYVDKDTLHTNQYGEQKYCVHLIYCPECYYDIRKAWEMVII